MLTRDLTAEYLAARRQQSRARRADTFMTTKIAYREKQLREEAKEREAKRWAGLFWKAQPPTPLECPRCGKRLTEEIAVTCDVCGRKFCPACTERIVELLTEHSVHRLCVTCADIVCERCTKEYFQLRVEEAKKSRFATVCADAVSACKIAAEEFGAIMAMDSVAAQRQKAERVLRLLRGLMMELGDSSFWTEDGVEDAGRKQVCKTLSSKIGSDVRLFGRMFQETHSANCMKQLDLVTDIYVDVYRCRLDAMGNQRFDECFKDVFAEALRLLLSDVREVTRMCNVKWEYHKANIDERILSIDSDGAALMTNSQRVGIMVSDGAEGRLMRKMLELLSRQTREVYQSVDLGELLDTKYALEMLSDTIKNVLSDALHDNDEDDLFED